MMPTSLISNWNISTKNLGQLIEEENSAVDPKPVHFLSAHAVVEASKSILLNEIFKSGKTICDSRPLNVYLNQFIRATPQVRGTDFMKSMLLSANEKTRHYFLGGDSKTLFGIENYIRANRQTEIVMCFNSPSYTIPWQEEISTWIDQILEFNADYVWVGMGAPKQFYISYEIFRSLKIPAYSVGAAFDFVAGTKKESPKLISMIGLEWVFRLITEPRRLWRRYLIGNLVFVKILVFEFWSRKKNVL